MRVYAIPVLSSYVNNMKCGALGLRRTNKDMEMEWKELYLRKVTMRHGVGSYPGHLYLVVIVVENKFPGSA